MVTTFSSPVLSVAVDAVRDLEGKDALGGLWNLFTKCKESLQDGRRLENISWRLWHRELVAGAHHHADSPGCVIPDRNAASTAAPLSPISDYGRGSSQDFDQHRLRSPSPALSVQSAISGTSSRPCSVRSNSSSSIGRIIVDMLPENKIDTTPPSRRPSISGPPEPVSFKAASSSLPTPEAETIAAPFPTVILPPITTHVSPAAPTAFPRVVIVNPTPHPTPPATPAPGPAALAAPQPLPHTHLLPPPRLLSVSQARSSATAQVTEPQEAVKQPPSVPIPQPMPALSAPVPAPAKSSAAEGKAVDRRFFLEQSPDNQSASSQASSSPARSGPSERAPSAEAAARSPSIVSARSPSSEAGSLRGADPSSVNSNQTHASVTSRRSGQHRSHQPRHNMTRARFSQRMHPLVQRKAAGTEAQHKAGSKGMFDVGSLGSDVSHATSGSQRRPSNSTGKASPSPAASSALAPQANGKARAAAEVRPVEPRKPAAPARPPLMRAQTGPAHMGSRVTTPAPQPLAKAPSVTATKSALKQPSTSKQPAGEPPRRKVVVASSDEYETTEGSDTESEDGSTSDWEDDEEEQPKPKNKADEARLRAAALEAQRQRELFDKLPKRSYSNLNRTQSGLLSQLLNPDPSVLPTNHARSSSSANLQRGFAPAPMLSSSQSMAAIPQLSNITAQAPQARVDNHYRPRGRPAEQELEDDSSSDEEDGLSRSLAQQKLAELTDPNRRRRRSDQDQEPPRRTSPERSTLTSVATAPIPLNHPWNLPAPAPPMTPRTTRRQMLSTELSESLRRNLLWERQVSKTNLLRGGLRPLTQTHPEPRQPEPESEEQRRERERKERNKAAIARHRSWADDYHTSGW